MYHLVLESDAGAGRGSTSGYGAKRNPSNVAALVPLRSVFCVVRLPTESVESGRLQILFRVECTALVHSIVPRARLKQPVTAQAEGRVAN